jgi:hypothetical protein
MSRVKISTIFLVTALVLVVGFSARPLFAQTDAEDDARSRENASRLANLQVRWGPPMNSPGAEIHLKQISERTDDGHRAIVYRLFATGFPKGEGLALEEVSMDLEITPVMEGISLDDSGQAICSGKPGTCGDTAKPDDPINFVVSAAKGEPKRFSLVSEDGMIKAFTYVVPFPISGKDAACSVEAILLSENADALLVRGSGFKPRAAVRHTVVSEGETRESDVTANQNGEFTDVELPAAKGKTKGTATASFHSSDCNPSLSYDWGEGSYQLQ